MSGELRQRFISALISTGQVPVWAEYHRVASMNPNNLNRFDNITAVTTPILTSLQKSVGGHPSSHHSAIYHFSPEFLRAYTQILGYQRNRENALFRTDISGVFRGDHRTPDELASHGKMIAFSSGHTEQHTTDITLCTSTAYGDAYKYGRENTGSAEHFHYGYQDDDEYYSFDSGDESDDDESGALRRRQKDGFVYLIDTRGMEAVPIADNQVLNPDNATVGGMTVSAEIHVSVPRTGLPSNRIWLVNGDGTKAVKIDDLREHFHEELSSLETQTFAGINSDAYNYLFIKAENKGLLVLDLSEITPFNALKNIRHYEHRHYPALDQNLRASPSHIPPAGHVLYAYEIAVVNPDDENAMIAAGQWLREDQTRRHLVDINGVIYSPNGNPLELASSELVRRAFRQQIASLPTDQHAQVLFIRDKSSFSSNIQWNGQTLPDTQQKIGRFIHQYLAGVNPVNLRVTLDYMTVINDLDANNEPLPRRSEVTIDYMAPLSLSPEGHTVVAPLVMQLGTSRPTGLFGGNAAFNESLRPVDSADLPRARNHLTFRLWQVLELMDALHANRRQLSTLDAEESRNLTDFFHRRDGSLNQEAIAKALSQPRVYQLWRNNVVQLLQLRGVHTQLAGLSGQRALTRSQNWSEQQVSAITDWKTFEAQWPDVRVDLAPQALFLGDKSRYARTFSTALGLGLLAADQQGAPAVANYLTGLTTHARLNEEAVEGQQSDYDRRQVRQLRQLFDDLRMLPEAHPTIFSRQSLPATYTELAVGHYLLKVNQQVLALSVKENGHFSLYRPRVGLMQINGAEANENRQALVAALRTQLNTSTEVSLYKVDIASARRQFSALASLQRLLGDYQTDGQRLSRAPDITLSQVTLPVKLLRRMGAQIDGKSFSIDHLERLTPTALAEKLRFDAKKLSRYLHQADYSQADVQQAVCFLRQQLPSQGSMASLLVDSNNTAARDSALAQLEIIGRQVIFKPQPVAPIPDRAGSRVPTLRLEVAPTLGAALKNVPIDLTGTGLQRFTGRAGNTMQGYAYLRALSDIARYDKLLESKELTAEQRAALTFEKDLAIASFTSNIVIDLTQAGLSQWGSRLTQLGVRSGFKLQLARFGGPLLGALSSGFDFYQVLRSFSQLAVTTDPQQRQDLIVAGSLSLAGAVISISVPIAFAIGGTAASIAGPVGLAFGAVLLMVGGIYSAMREVEEIKKVVNLSGWERFLAGSRAFFGQQQSTWIQNNLAHHATEEAARIALAAQQEQTAKMRLRANITIDTLYQSKGKLKIKENQYTKIVATDIAGHEHLIEDGILPADNTPDRRQDAVNAWLSKYQHGNHSLHLLPGSVKMKNSALFYYTPELEETDDVIDLNNKTEPLPATALKKGFIGAQLPTGTFSTGEKVLTTRLNPLQNDYRTIAIDIDGDGHTEMGYFSQESGFHFVKYTVKDGYSAPQHITSIPPLIEWSTLRTGVGDINGDGWDDLVVSGDNQAPLQIYVANKDSTFSHREQTSGMKLSRLDDTPWVLADVDKDGRKDLVSFTRGVPLRQGSRSGDVNLHYGQAGGTFEAATSVSLATLSPRPASVVNYLHSISGDINGDGNDDIVSMTQTGALYILAGSGDRVAPFIAKAVQHHSGLAALLRTKDFNSRQIQLRDTNDDGQADLLVIQDDGRYTIAEGQADGTFGEEREAARQNLFAPRGEYQLVDMIEENGEKQFRSLGTTGEIVHTPFHRPSEAESVNKVSLGGGNDTAIGELTKKNDFDIGQGTKKFTGGHLADRFLLLGQAAPTMPSLLDGGSELADKSDTLVAAGRQVDNKSYLLALNIGLAAYYSKSQRQEIIERLDSIAQLNGEAQQAAIAQLKALPYVEEVAQLNNIENAYGQSEIEVLLRGDDGNNTLGLGRGYAAGGKGTDVYAILRHRGNEAASVVLSEQVSEQEDSHVFLDYDAEEIADISHFGQDVKLRLRNDTGQYTELYLKNMYRLSTDTQHKTRQHQYILYTRDGVCITGWPTTVFRNSNRDWPRQLNLTAQYIPDYDQSRRVALNAAQPGSVEVELISPSRESEKQIKVSINGKHDSPTVIPHFLQLAYVGTKFSTRLQGDRHDNRLSTTLLSGDTENNRLWHSSSSDRLKGNGGMDQYLIGPGSRHIVIDNQDDGSTNGGEIASDNLIVPWLLKEIRLEEEGNDIILTHRDAPALHPTIRISNFKQSGQYRHLWVQAKDSAVAELCFDASNRISLGQQIVTTEGNDYIMVLHETTLRDNSVVLGAGDDIFLDASDGGYQINGGQGDDYLQGGAGADVYQYAAGDGHDLVRDSGGYDKLVFAAGISKEELRFERNHTDLKIAVGERGSVTLKGHFASTENKIEMITAGQYQVDVSLLNEAMASFDAQAGSATQAIHSTPISVTPRWLLLPNQAALV
ncbi:FG-GAP-like repeat-containing protein [Candidatus Fukatsuia endosymbiont of Tuberolachnus salignus]|uniref:FG-GAP-like repeat-containing protein n=1 Tax=Candidatus Fukatsuia endosymbiont of Tuberolachnus salignus TaxID=3077957 RepID=UPI00313DD6F2